MRRVVCEYQTPLGPGETRPPRPIAPYVLSGYKWHNKKTIKWFFKDTSSRPQNLIIDDIREDIRRAYQDGWEIFGGVVFVECLEITDADIIIQFSPTPPPEAGQTNWDVVTLAMTVFPETGTLDAGDMFINPNFPWACWYSMSQRNQSIPGNSYDLGTVIIHEGGHSLGLGHSLDSSAVMYAYYHFIQFPFKLPKDDQLAIRAVYGVSSLSDNARTRLLSNMGYKQEDLA